MRHKRAVPPQPDGGARQMMFLTLPVLAYQLLFVAVLYVASRFGSTKLKVAMVVCLI